MSISLSIVIGVIAGIVTTLILELSRRIFLKIIIPWYQALVYKGIDVTGEWQASVKSSTTQANQPTERRFTMTIKQKGHKIIGDFSIQNLFQVETKNSVSNYKLSGSISDNYVCMNYARRSQKKIGLGNLLFKVTGLGDRLKGKGTFLSSLDNIDSHDLNFKRDK